MMIAEQQQFLIAAGDSESIGKLVPVIILVVFSIISAIAKKRNESKQEEEEQEQKTALPPRKRPDYRVPQPPRQQPGRAPLPGQRQVPRQVQRPVPPPTPQRAVLRQQIPVAQPIPDERHPKETFDRVNKPISTAAPASVGKIEHDIQERLVRTEKIQPARVLKAEQMVETALKPSVLPPAEVAQVEAVEALDMAGLEIDLHDPRKLREAILYREIFDLPLALR